MDLPINQILNMDCLDFMKDLPDKCIDLVLTDPPYGINADGEQNKAALQRIKAEGNSKAGRGWKLYPETAWDKNRPQKQYFDGMIRISKISIIWGGELFCRPITRFYGLAYVG